MNTETKPRLGDRRYAGTCFGCGAPQFDIYRKYGLYRNEYCAEGFRGDGRHDGTKDCLKYLAARLVTLEEKITALTTAKEPV